jgi:molecular chaperone GrpE
MSDTVHTITLSAGKPSQKPSQETAPETLPTVKDTLLSRFATYLDGLDDAALYASAAAAKGALDGDDLFSVFVELAGLRNETRTQSRLVKEALDQFRDVFDTLQASHATLQEELKRARAQARERERELVKPLLLHLIDIRDRLTIALKATNVPARWYERFHRTGTHTVHEAAREGMRMLVRRLDRILAERRVIATETAARRFDPRIAVAVATVADRAIAEGHVVEEVRPGFLWEDELLRPAEVIVSKCNEKDEA